MGPPPPQIFCFEIVHACQVALVMSDSVALWNVAGQAPLSAGFSRQEYWSGMPYPCPGNLPKPVIKPRSPALQADFLPFELPGRPYSTL